MSGTGESVVRMANQIARNFAVHGDERAVAETANHIAMFWDPRMRAKALALLQEPDSGFSDPARAALATLSAKAENG